MSIQPEYDRRTADRTTNRTPDTHQLAAELNVDAALLREFVDHHPNPTAAIVLGWVNREGDADPSKHTEDVENWLDAYTARSTPEPTPVSLADDLADDGRLPGRWFQ